ncbi:unnamed protein product [Amoebophrya sp. A25]|nr:unnamed protein product [Amoebophrya sp. A25]|eukprot:GSA25T00019472001.1
MCSLAEGGDGHEDSSTATATSTTRKREQLDNVARKLRSDLADLMRRTPDFLNTIDFDQRLRLQEWLQVIEQDFCPGSRSQAKVAQQEARKTIKTVPALFDVNSPGGTSRWTPLHLAGHMGSLTCVRLLLDAKADLFRENAEARLPRYAAKSNFATSKILKQAEDAALYRPCSAVVGGGGGGAGGAK